MLALTRKPGQEIVINDNIVITIVDVKGENIRVAIEAPRDVKIYRGELYQSIVAENQEAAQPASLDALSELGNLPKK